MCINVGTISIAGLKEYWSNEVSAMSKKPNWSQVVCIELAEIIVPHVLNLGRLG